MRSSTTPIVWECLFGQRSISWPNSPFSLFLRICRSSFGLLDHVPLHTELSRRVPPVLKVLLSQPVLYRLLDVSISNFTSKFQFDKIVAQSFFRQKFRLLVSLIPWCSRTHSRVTRFYSTKDTSALLHSLAVSDC